jgi:hypothetical protein
LFLPGGQIYRAPNGSSIALKTHFKQYLHELIRRSAALAGQNNLISFLSSAQALIAPFPSFEYSLLDGAGDDEAIENLQEHLRRRIDERHRLNLVKIDNLYHFKSFLLFSFS